MKTVLILSGVPFNFMKQRPHHMAEFFAQQGFRVLYLGLGEKVSQSSIHDFEHLELKDVLNKYSNKISDNLYVLNNILLESLDTKKGFLYLTKKINDFVDEDNLVIFVEHPYWVDYLTPFSSKVKLIYDCIDDWEGFVKDLDYGLDTSLIQKERKLAGIADLVLTSAKRLYGKMSVYNKNIYYLPNGVWSSHYNANDGLTSEIRNINKPIVFFMGGIAGWVDIELIEYLASNRPNYSFVFVGDTIKCKLPLKENIFYLGKKKYEELPLFLKKADVGIIPFKETNLTASVTPLKYYEYLSAGVPVVSTMLPDLVHLPGSRVVQNYEEFLAALDYYLNLDESSYEMASLLAKETIKDFDWNKLLQPLCYYIEDDKRFKMEKRDKFISDSIHTYELFKSNNVIKNELLNLYNLIEDYNKSTNLFPYSQVIKETLTIDYNQLSLAYYMKGDMEKSFEMLEIYLKRDKKLILHSKYIQKFKSEGNGLLFKSFLLKICGQYYEALKILNSMEVNAKTSGLLASIYFDMDEYNLAFDYAYYSLGKLSNWCIDELMDPYTILNLIDFLISQKEFKVAEEVCFEFIGRDRVLEEAMFKKLGEIYFLINSPSTI